MAQIVNRVGTTPSRAHFSGRFPMESYRELLLGKATGIKNVITIGG